VPATQDCVEVVVTGPTMEWLATFTRGLVDDRLVACGHLLGPIRAIYRWDGAVHDEAQARVGLHTRASLVPAIVARADRDHPDHVPCVIAVPLVGGHGAYLQWIVDETTEPGSGGGAEPLDPDGGDGDA
jgi:periplasmic divalent cation tolerance protein